MILILRSLLLTLCNCLRGRMALQTETLALRQQLPVLRRSIRHRFRITATDRLFWPRLSRLSADFDPRS